MLLSLFGFINVILDKVNPPPQNTMSKVVIKTFGSNPKLFNLYILSKKPQITKQSQPVHTVKIVQAESLFPNMALSRTKL